MTAYTHAWVRLPPPSPLILQRPTAGPQQPLRAALGVVGAAGGGTSGGAGTGRGRKRGSVGDSSAAGAGPGASGASGAKGKGSAAGSTPFATAASGLEGRRSSIRAAYNGDGGDADGEEPQQSRPRGRRRMVSRDADGAAGGDVGEGDMGRQPPPPPRQQRQQRSPRGPPQGGEMEQGEGGAAWERPMGRDGQQPYQQQRQQYPRKGGWQGQQQQQGGRRFPSGSYNGNGGGGGGGGERRNHGQGLPGGGWLSVAHHKGEGARERLITSHLKNAGNAGGVPGLLEKAEEYLGELNAVHCTMLINR